MLMTSAAGANGAKLEIECWADLDRASLNFLDQGAAGAELTARSEFYVDLAVGGILDIILEIPLHDRIGPGCPEDISGGHDSW